MSYEDLTLSGFAKEMKEVSDGPHPRKFCFVLGAGASRSSGIKSGQELVNIWEKDLLERNKEGYSEWKQKFGINDSNKYEFYGQYYEKRFKKPIDGYNYLEKLMESAKPSIGYVMLAYILTHTKHNVVITTNFDHLIEDAVNYYEDKIPLVIGHESLAHYITKQTNRPMIIKIHRDLLLDPKNSTKDLDVLHDDWKKALDIIFSEYYPIFIGYAGNDHSLMDYLTQNSDIFSDENGIFPYWMLYKTDKMSEMVSDFLEKSGGYLIKHDGFDDVLCLLGSVFNCKLPTKEDLIKRAEERYEMLSDSIDAITEKLSVGKEMNLEEDDVAADTVPDLVSDTADVKKAVDQITSQAELQNLFKEAVALSDAGSYQEAMEHFRKLTEKNPQNVRYYDWLGYTLFKLKRYEEACRELHKAVELEPGNAKYHNSVGATLHEMSRYEEALEEKQKAVELDPGNSMYCYNLGVTLHEMGRYEEALEEKQKAVELEPGNARYHNSIGVTLHEMGLYEEALEEKQKGVELESQSAKYHNSLGVTLHKMGHYEEALKEKQKAVELEPESAKYHDGLSVTLHEMGRYEDARKETEKAIELEPGNAKYHNSLGITLHAMGLYEEALKAKQKAEELDPENESYRTSLDVTLQKLS